MNLKIPLRSMLLTSYSCPRRWRSSPELKVAQIIREFSTPWPKQSYHRATDVTKEYDRKFQAITKSITMIVMFFVTSFISIPPSIQDMVIHMGTTAVSGYTALVHVRLYKIYPVLVVVPTVILAAIVHFWVQVNRMQQRAEFVKTFGNSEGLEATDIIQKPISRPETGRQEENRGDSKHNVITRRQSVVHGIQIATKAEHALQVKKYLDEQGAFKNVQSVDESEDEPRQTPIQTIASACNLLPSVEGEPIVACESAKNEIKDKEEQATALLNLAPLLVEPIANLCDDDDLDMDLSSDNEESVDVSVDSPSDSGSDSETSNFESEILLYNELEMLATQLSTSQSSLLSSEFALSTDSEI
jgi:hypothetical protein